MLLSRSFSSPCLPPWACSTPYVHCCIHRHHRCPVPACGIAGAQSNIHVHPHGGERFRACVCARARAGPMFMSARDGPILMAWCVRVSKSAPLCGVHGDEYALANARDRPPRANGVCTTAVAAPLLLDMRSSGAAMEPRRALHPVRVDPARLLGWRHG